MSKSKKSRSGSISGSGKNSNSVKKSSGGRPLSQNEYVRKHVKKGGKEVTLRYHFDKTGEHPHVIVRDLSDQKKYVSVGLSSKADPENKNESLRTVPMLYSPTPDKSLSCRHVKATVDSYHMYSRKSHSAVVSSRDFREMSSAADKALSDYIKRNK